MIQTAPPDENATRANALAAPLKAFNYAHLIGIAGAGMRALARAMMQNGIAVSGSDMAPVEKSEELTAAGARVMRYHAAENLPQRCDVVVFSSAISDSNPEIREARRRGIPILHRTEMLAKFLDSRESVLVAGTHGKTTTTTMLGLLLTAAGSDPWVFVGGEVREFGGNVRCGGLTTCVVEADESDGTFLGLPGSHAIVTNVESEHLSFWKTDAAMYEGFAQFARRFAEGALVACADQEGAAALARAMPFPVTTYSIHERGGDFYATGIVLAGRESHYTLHAPGGLAMRVELGVPGLHNVSNSLAAYAMAARLGADIAGLGTVLAQFRGVGRRFTSYELPGGVLVVDDYAHHATEVAATIQAARLVQERGSRGRILAVFQPHRYSRIQHLFDQFRVCFAGADVAFITDIYGAGEEAIPGIDGASLARHVGGTGVVEAIHVATPAEAAARARQMARPGDMILFLGAGNITDAARTLVAAEKGTQL